MLFNSLDFAIFLPIIFLSYWYLFNFNLKIQNLLLLVASYIFYGFWDWRFLSLILFSTLVDYIVGIKLGSEDRSARRKLLVLVSLFVNLGFLGIFKYYNFFLDNLVTAFSFFGMQINPRSLNVILPVGISFYTFQTLSYSIDVYRRKIEPTKDFIAFAAFVSFFPQLVAGPIERASNLLPQFYKRRTLDFDFTVEGVFLIIWGLFKKIVIADNAAELVNLIFADNTSYSGSVLLLGAILFAFQIYGDFSGYSDIAIGTARLFGFKIMINFKFPYLSRDIAEFWRRWHISLTTWFRDYIYIPIGGSRVGIGKKIRNVLIIFIISGFWHGANWTFIIWGLLNAVFFLPLILSDKNRKNLNYLASNRFFPTVREIGGIFFTFFITIIAWIFFRSESLSAALSYLSGIFDLSILTLPKMTGIENSKIILSAIFVMILIALEYTYRMRDFVFESIGNKSVLLHSVIIFLLVAVIYIFGGNQQDFIYFQF